MHHKFSEQQIQYIVDRAQHDFRQDIATNLNLTVKQVEYLAKLHHIPLLHKPKGQYQRKYKYTFNHHYFDTIDTPNKAYIVGFIFADGNIYLKDGKYRLTIGLSQKDKCVLDFINLELGGNLPIIKKQVSSKYHSCWFTIDSKHMITALVNVGIKPRKTYLTTIPTIPKRFRKYFLLGVFDGDGCVATYTRTRGKYFCRDYKWHIVAKQYLTLDKLRNYCSMQQYGNIIKSNSWHVWYVCSRKKILEIYHLLYDGKCWSLNRKKKIFEEMM